MERTGSCAIVGVWKVHKNMYDFKVRNILHWGDFFGTSFLGQRLEECRDLASTDVYVTARKRGTVGQRDPKGVSTLRRGAKCNTMQLCHMAKVALHMPQMRSRPHEKIIFLQTFRLQKLWNETGELCLIFFSNWLIPFWNPYSSYAATNNLLIEFLGCATSNGMLQPSRRNVHIYLRHGTTFAARPCRTVAAVCHAA